VLGFPLDALIHSLAERRILHKRTPYHDSRDDNFYTFSLRKTPLSLMISIIPRESKNYNADGLVFFNRMMTDYDNLFSFRRKF